MFYIVWLGSAAAAVLAGLLALSLVNHYERRALKKKKVAQHGK